MANQTVYLKFYAPVNDNSVKALMNVIEQKLQQGVKKFVLLISSGGGNVFAGVTAYNFLKGVPAEVITHNFGSAVSIALVLFCAGTRRLSVPHATFLLHGVQANFPQGAGLEEKQLEERLKGLKLDMENIAGIIAANTGRSEQEVMKAMLDRTTLNPEQAVEYGLVHEIREPLFEEGSDFISIQG